MKDENAMEKMGDTIKEDWEQTKEDAENVWEGAKEKVEDVTDDR